MNSNLKLLPAALLVAVLALAGCGGGDSTPAEPAEPTEPTEPTEPAGPTALETSATAKNAALAARKEAIALLNAARVAAASTTTAKVDGDSRLAEDNAGTVIAATALIMAEETKAATAVATLEGIDTTGLTADQMQSVAADVMAAKDALAEIKAILADDTANSLMMIVKTLMGTSTDETKVAASRNKAVASAIKTAIAGTLVADGSTFSTSFASVRDDLVPVSANLMSVGMDARTFRQINGSDSLRAKDAKLTVFTFTTTPTAIDVGSPVTDAVWKGIPGTLTCISDANCAIENGVIRGTVQFTPDEPATFYAPTDDGTGYKEEGNAAVYGYWLDSGGTAVAIKHHAATRSDVTQATGTNIDGLNWTWDDLGLDEAGENVVTTLERNANSPAVTASYEGRAGGFSERTIGAGSAAQSASGHFVADASLKATFGDTNATIDGTIRNFSAATGSAGSGHVNTNWVVALDATEPTSGVIANAVVDQAHEYRSSEVGATGGRWSANAYGAPRMRPTGFVGAFSAAFRDGSAAGVYHVEAD